MKTLVKMFLLMVVISLAAGCNKTDEFFDDDSIELKSAKNQEQTRSHGLDQDRFVMMEDIDLKVHYRIIGKGPIDMVFIPGWTNPLEVYSKQFDYFRDKARCIYIDLPGTGKSDAPEPNNPLDPDSEGFAYVHELMADAIKTVIKKEGVKKFIGVGFSWSGTTLKLFEMKYPGMLQQLILLDISIETWPPRDEAYRVAQWNFWSPLSYEEKLGLLPSFIKPATAPEDLWQFGLDNWPDFSSPLLANMRYYWLAEENCQPYPWNIPILVVYNEMNEAKEAKTLLHYPGCEIVVLDGEWHVSPYQHVIQWAYQDVVNQLIDDFMVDRPGKKY